jgi:hypothetical protein
MGSLTYKRTFFSYAFAIALCFSVLGLCLGTEAFCHSHHASGDSADITITSHTHQGHSHATSFLHVTGAHKSHNADSHKHCCQSSPKKSSHCIEVLVLDNTIKTFGCSLAAANSPQIAYSIFSLPAMDCIAGLSNVSNPSLVSLRTVILLA